MAQCHMDNGMYQEALTHVSKARGLFPGQHHGWLWFISSTCQEKLGHCDRALSDIDWALNFQSLDARYLIHRGPFHAPTHSRSFLSDERR
jgi:hypothetical protein